MEEGGGEQVIGTVRIPEESSGPTPAEWCAAKREKCQTPAQPPPGLPWALTASQDMNPVAVGLLRDTILTLILPTKNLNFSSYCQQAQK